MKKINIINYKQVNEQKFCAYEYRELKIKMGLLDSEKKYSLSLKEKQENADFFYEFILNIINDSDGVIFSGYPEEEISFYKRNLNYLEYDLPDSEDYSILGKTGLCFNIASDEEKKVVINNLKFNLEEYEDWWPDFNLHVRVIDIDRDYVANNENYNHYENLLFLKDNLIIAGIKRRDGVIEDYTNCYERFIKKEIKTK